MKAQSNARHRKSIARTDPVEPLQADSMTRLTRALEERDAALRQALEQQAVTSEVLKTISRSRFDVASVLERLIENAVRLCAADGGVVYRFDRGAHRIAAAHKMPPAFHDFVERNPIEPGPGTAAGRAAMERRTIHVPDITSDGDHRYPAAHTLGQMRSVLSAPMITEAGPVGVLTLWRSTRSPFTERQIERLTLFADQAAIAIENARLFQEIEDKNKLLEAKNAELRSEIEAHQRARAMVHCLEDEIRGGTGKSTIVGRSTSLKRLLEQVSLVSSTDSTVLVLGETGTGKELVARAVHESSARCDGPLIKVNCAALPHELIESELFGHEKGAFTGATQQRRGRFELADRGTLFLDEIAELSLEAQAKLLRVLQEGEFERVGGARTLRTDARVVVATNRNLHERMLHGEFRADLYYRLNVFPLMVPPLRERREDIPALVQLFLATVTRKLGKRFDGVAPGFIEQLMAYDWPGNVRELQNIVERAAILSRGAVLESVEPLAMTTALGSAYNAQPSTAPRAMAEKTLLEVEREHIQHALQCACWVIEGERGAALALGVHPSTLRGRMRKLGIHKGR